MRRGTMVGGVFAVAMAVFTVGVTLANAQNYSGGSGMMGPGMMGMGYGMMGCPMCGPSMMGGGYAPPANLNLSTNDVKGYLERMLAMMGNHHLAVGPVAEKDATTITADIVTKDKGDIAQRFSVDRHTGIYRPID